MKPVIKVNDKPVVGAAGLFFMALDPSGSNYAYHAELPATLENKESMLDVLMLTVNKLNREIKRGHANNNPGLNIYINQVSG